MEHNEKVEAIKFIRPNAQFVLSGNDLTWLDENQDEPTPAEIELGCVAYQAKLESDKVAKAAQKATLLDRLGITEDEAKLLLA
jgi:hypothetical protein